MAFNIESYMDMLGTMSAKGHAVHALVGSGLGGAAFIGMHHHVKKENGGKGGHHPLLKAKGAGLLPELGTMGALAYGYKKKDSALGRLFYHGKTIEDIAKHGESL